MAQITVVYWRDIPAQVLAGKGRRAAKVQLSPRFEHAIDRAAMRAGAAETDAYLADWRKVSEGEREGTDAEAAAARAAELEAEWIPERLRDAALAGGIETRGAA
ncbi:virulence factor [Jannaschia seohaensis]|uniref:Virulence factor n=1 Tax=Jannaschia seohaensis TaxID=475081 RepID=A0A2Y9AFE3_9RHOB|nr:virulence factor [Jannaschia seohaensis]PWJ20889.1 cvfA/B/C family virulence factor [Jannaschia seohaensis]SSA41299.1 Virulence factor [Jannaschia seohaensis]